MTSLGNSFSQSIQILGRVNCGLRSSFPDREAVSRLDHRTRNVDGRRRCLDTAKMADGLVESRNLAVFACMREYSTAEKRCRGKRAIPATQEHFLDGRAFAALQIVLRGFML